MRSLNDGDVADVVKQVVEIVMAENPDQFTLSPKGHMEIHSRIKTAMKMAQKEGAQETVLRFQTVGNKVLEEIKDV